MMQTTKEVITAANIHLHILLLSVGCCSAEKHRAPSVVPCSSIRLSVPVCKYGPHLSSSTGGEHTPSFSPHDCLQKCLNAFW
uniref:Putative secreted protein n=1 Tax=Rhipicephalus microplus TaxID=6941 RepID=A0A6M2DAQ7_RHIMP